jgi:pyruvate kinase
MKVQILCTLGPSSLREDVIGRLDERGVDLFRINLSHTPLDALAPAIELVQGCSATPICLDTEGAQVRCGVMAPDVALIPGRTILLTAAERVGSTQALALHPGTALGALQPGSTLSVDFDGALLQVTEADPAGVTAVVLEGGRIRSNKAVTVHPPPVLPPLTDKDLRAIAVARCLGIGHFALSFASQAEDVALLRSLVPPGAVVIAKIESRAGVRNMDGIISASEAVLIDRGDLSREVPIEHVPFYQKVILRRANRWNRPAYVATNLLESMVANRQPTVAEADDIVNTLLDGVHGLVLAAETAVGVDPVGAVDMVLRVIAAFERWSVSSLLDEDSQPVASLVHASTNMA